jgi:hypothetical protein
MTEAEKQEWSKTRLYGKYQYILKNSVLIILSSILPYFLLRFVISYFQNHLSLQELISSRVIIDYVVEGIGWLFAFWLAISFFFLLRWINSEKEFHRIEYK